MCSAPVALDLFVWLSPENFIMGFGGRLEEAFLMLMQAIVNLLISSIGSGQMPQNLRTFGTVSH